MNKDTSKSFNFLLNLEWIAKKMGLLYQKKSQYRFGMSFNVAKSSHLVRSDDFVTKL